jgi:hypothetical protein
MMLIRASWRYKSFASPSLAGPTFVSRCRVAGIVAKHFRQQST